MPHLCLMKVNNMNKLKNNNVMKTSNISSKTIVLIHGLFVNPTSWTEWEAYFEKLGYNVHTPANLYHEGNPQQLRNQFDPRLPKVDFEQVVMNHVKFIDSLPEQPILIGHSLGGLIVQKLLSLGKGVAGVTVDGAAPGGIITTKWSFWKSSFPVIDFFKGNSVFMPSKKWFHYTFGNTLSREESDKVYEKIAVPESRNIARGTLKKFGRIDMKKPHQPLLFIAGELDNIIPADLNRKNFKAYTDKNSIREYKEFAGRGHYICGENNWQEVAGYVENWLESISVQKVKAA